MKNILKISVSCMVLLMTIHMLSGCKKFLDINSITQQSGNNYWLTTDDYDKYMLNIYSKFREYTMMNSNVTWGILFFPGIGDFRNGPYIQNNNTQRTYLTLLPANNLNTLINNSTYSWGFKPITDWTEFYRIIASCNILVEQLNNEKIGMSAAKKSELMGEAIFMRNMVYFLLVKIFGDVPYNNIAYHSDPLPRTDMIEVINNCIADLSSVVPSMPWEPNDQSFKNIRAQKGAGLALLMHMNMWNAGFDQGNRMKYYTSTDSLGRVLMETNGGAHTLLPIEDFRLIFKGSSKEGLFEIPQSLNKRETFKLFSTFADNFLKFPHKRYAGQPGEPKQTYVTFSGKFFDDMFPESRQSDRRRTLWYMQSDPNDRFTLECLKYSNIYAEDNEDVNPDDNQIIFRLADAVLLRAEACEGLGKTDEAITYLNMIRSRAGSPDYREGETQGFDLSDAIWMERNIELIGEAHYFFDLVRTKRILDSKYTNNPMSAEAFAAGAWTWPINPKALTNNPYMRLNEYWLR